jgi:hypothetical protein
MRPSLGSLIIFEDIHAETTDGINLHGDSSQLLMNARRSALMTSVCVVINPCKHVQTSRPDFGFHSVQRFLWAEAATLDAGQPFYDT